MQKKIAKTIYSATLTFSLCVEVEDLTLFAPTVAVLGRDFGLVAGVRDEGSERVGLLVEVALGARGQHFPRRKSQVVPRVRDIVVLRRVTLKYKKKKRENQGYVRVHLSLSCCFYYGYEIGGKKAFEDRTALCSEVLARFDSIFSVKKIGWII